MATSSADVHTADPAGAQKTMDDQSSVAIENSNGTIEPKKSTHSSTIAGTEDVTTKALRFLSTASNEMLAGIGVGLSACTYLILGRVGLILIGAIGGVVLHATWEGQSALTGVAEDARREKGMEIVKRLLDWREAEAQKDSEEDSDDSFVIAGRGFEGFRPETAAALSELVEATLRDYVKWWYTPILPADESFPAACRHTLTTFLRSVSVHLSRKRPADTFLDFLTNSSSIVIVFLNELASAMSASQGIGLSPEEAVQEYLAYYPDSNLANVLNERQQKKKFRMIAEDILQNFLDKSVLECNQTRIFLREIWSGVILEMSLTACSKPEWINGWIVHLLEDGEPELIQAIDIGMGSAPSDDADVNKTKRNEEKKHRKRLSKAEEAMEEAMEEAKRLSQLIAEEDMQRLRGVDASRRDTVTTKPLERTLETDENNPPQQPPRPTESAQPQQPPRPAASTPPQQPPRPAEKTQPQQAFQPTESISPLQPPRHGSNGYSQDEVGDLETKTADVRSEKTSPMKSPTASNSQFTSFDQIVPQYQPTALQAESQRPRRATASLTLHNASIMIHDDSTANDKGRIRNKPTGDYLVQIEPESSDHPGWMIVRHYSDFETLHEVLRRIAAISGVAAFTEQHSVLPSWKAHTKASLRGELERYLRDACWHKPLAESEGLKRFLEKDQAQMQANSNKGLGWPSPAAFESMGKGMLEVLTSAPKGAADGGKAVLGGVTGVFGNISSLGQKKRESTSSFGTNTSGKTSTNALPQLDSNTNSISSTRLGMESEENLRVSPIVHTQPTKIPPMERKPSYASASESGENEAPKDRISLSGTRTSRSSMSGRVSTSNSRTPSRAPSLGPRVPSPRSASVDVERMVLPPPPSDIPDDYGVQTDESSMGHSRTDSLAATSRTSTSSTSRPSLSGPTRPLTNSTPQPTPRKQPKERAPVSEQETRVAVELLFAVINELYTLSSAWNIRRTLLTAAKTFLLRPGNPSLASIQALIQDSIIVSNTSDAGIAAHIRKIRENSMPTEEELKAWPAEMTADEKEKLRVRARKLLVERGVPAALTGVMGQAATNEAMGRVFDCLQVEEVARGLMFGLLLQGVRAMTH
jgi:hypothetical protein